SKPSCGLAHATAGLLFYGPGPNDLPLFGGTLRVATPLTRTAGQFWGENPPPDDCSGTFGIDFNALIQSAPPLTLVGCQTIYAQYWSRDPQAPTAVNLTDAIRFTIEPQRRPPGDLRGACPATWVICVWTPSCGPRKWPGASRRVDRANLQRMPGSPSQGPRVPILDIDPKLDPV
ncbi:MAG TPA: hypothetical protein VMT18_08730, partial [Planctomycetota bacterium]|nr:hypothetical protein [Planctomycetota bacterium]